MPDNTTPQPDTHLTPERIRWILSQISQAQTDSASVPPDLWQDYQHLMEIYAIVQAGGTQVQTEATLASQQRQAQQLQAETAPDQPQLLQELDDLERATQWRLHQLQQISPQAEAAVRICLTDIQTFLTQFSSSDDH
jgi:hypothetical protein